MLYSFCISHCGERWYNTLWYIVSVSHTVTYCLGIPHCDMLFLYPTLWYIVSLSHTVVYCLFISHCGKIVHKICYVNCILYCVANNTINLLLKRFRINDFITRGAEKNCMEIQISLKSMLIVWCHIWFIIHEIIKIWLYLNQSSSWHAPKSEFIHTSFRFEINLSSDIQKKKKKRKKMTENENTNQEILNRVNNTPLVRWRWSVKTSEQINRYNFKMKIQN